MQWKYFFASAYNANQWFLFKKIFWNKSLTTLSLKLTYLWIYFRIQCHIGLLKNVVVTAWTTVWPTWADWFPPATTSRSVATGWRRTCHTNSRRSLVFFCIFQLNWIDYCMYFNESVILKNVNSNILYTDRAVQW